MWARAHTHMCARTHQIIYFGIISQSIYLDIGLSRVYPTVAHNFLYIIVHVAVAKQYLLQLLETVYERSSITLIFEVGNLEN